MKETLQKTWNVSPVGKLDLHLKPAAWNWKLYWSMCGTSVADGYHKPLAATLEKNDLKSHRWTASITFLVNWYHCTNSVKNALWMVDSWSQSLETPMSEWGNNNENCQQRRSRNVSTTNLSILTERLLSMQTEQYWWLKPLSWSINIVALPDTANPIFFDSSGAKMFAEFSKAYQQSFKKDIGKYCDTFWPPVVWKGPRSIQKNSFGSQSSRQLYKISSNSEHIWINKPLQIICVFNWGN